MKKSYFYQFIRIIISPLFKIVFRPTYIGKEYIPFENNIILAGNHTSFLDPILLLSSTKRTVHFLAKKELTTGIFGFLFKSLAIIPVNRSKKNPKALNTAEEYLKQKEIIGIFPEGTINRTNDIIMSFKIGAVKMASNTNTKIVPFVITGKYKLFRKGITITFLEPYSTISNNLEEENKILERKIIDLLIKEK